MVVVVFLLGKICEATFACMRCWRSFARAGVHETMGRVDGSRASRDARSKAEEARHSPRNSGRTTARGTARAGQPALTHESRQHRAAARRTRAPGYSAPEVGACSEWSSTSAANVDAMAEIVNVDAFEDAGDDDPPSPPSPPRNRSSRAAGAAAAGTSKSSASRTTRATRGPEPINQRVKSLLRGRGWRQGTQRTSLQQEGPRSVK